MPESDIGWVYISEIEDRTYLPRSGASHPFQSSKAGLSPYGVFSYACLDLCMLPCMLCDEANDSIPVEIFFFFF